MTITSQPTVKTYACDGKTTAFPVPWRFLDGGDVLVQRIEADGSVHDLAAGCYQVTGAGEDTGGTVTTNAALPDGHIRVWLRMAAVQPNTYADNGPFPAQSHEDALDRLTLLSAINTEAFGRTLRAPLGEAGQELPPASARVGKLWAGDASGNLVFVPGIDNSTVVEALDYASAFYHTNLNATPCLVVDLDGQGTSPDPSHAGYQQITPIADIVNPLGLQTSKIAIQSSWPGGNYSGGGNLWCSAVYRNWTDANKPDQKRSKFVAAFLSMSQIDGAEWDHDPKGVISDEDWGTRVLGQECGGISAVAQIDNNVTNGKGEAIVAFARENAPVWAKDDAGNEIDTIVTPAGQGKLVAIQLGSVKNSRGPVPDDRNQIDDGDDDGPDKAGADAQGDPDAPQRGEPLAGLTLRINGAGLYRSWAACLVSGRGGYFNGFVVKRPKKLGQSFSQATGRVDASGTAIFETVSEDRDGIKGQYGVWGGRSYWAESSFAVYAKDECPGWITIGHDGIPSAGTGSDAAAGAPIDIVTPDGYDGPIMLVNGQAVDLGGVLPTGDTGSAPAKAATPSLASTIVDDPDGDRQVRLRATLAANAESDLAGYIFALSTDGGATYETVASDVPSRVWQVAIGQTCMVKAKAFNVVNRKGPFSDVATLVIDRDGGAPTGVIGGGAVTAAARKMVLSWASNPADKDFASLRIYRNTTNNAATAAYAGLDTHKFQFKVADNTDLVKGQAYYYWAAAVDRSGNEAATRTLVGSAVCQGVKGADLDSVSTTDLPDAKELARLDMSDLFDYPTVNSSGGSITLEHGVAKPQYCVKATGPYTVTLTGGGASDAFVVSNHASSSANLTVIGDASYTLLPGIEGVFVKTGSGFNLRLKRVLANNNSDKIPLAVVPTGPGGVQPYIGPGAGWAAMTGTASKGGFATSSVTTAQLAQVVKALLDGLTAQGLIGA